MLQTNLLGGKFCGKHKFDYHDAPIQKFVAPKQHIPKWSGKSKTPYGGYEER